ncbi:MAG: DUF4157 domain-containing protein [Heteroscytonema crispum UTEX LB 1556]
MTRDSKSQIPNSKSTSLTGSSILQRTAVRTISEEVEAPELTDNQSFRKSSFQHDFSQVPISTVSSSIIQPKLKIGAVGDKYEQEADRVARQVVSQMNAPGGETVQREEKPEEDEKLQMKPMIQRQAAGDGMAATPEVETSIQQARGSGQPLASNIKKPMEQAFAADFSGVKVHTDAQSDQLNQSIQAKAFTTGQNIFFRRGEYNPGSQGGKELIAHELTHVVQQNMPYQVGDPQATSFPCYTTNAHVIQRNTTDELQKLKQSKIVTNFLQSPEKTKLEQHIRAPKLTGNARDALKLANHIAKMKRSEDEAAVKTRMQKIGVDFNQYPNAYDLCANYLKNKKMTINFGTHLLEAIFSQKDYLNIWNRSFNQSDANYAAGRDLTERTLHDLPAIDPNSGFGTVRKPKQEFTQDLLPQGLASNKHKNKNSAAEKGDNLRKLIPERTEEDQIYDEHDKAMQAILGENWMDWYYQSRKDKKNTGQGIDRPISSAVNFSDYRGGGAAAYGTTHIELKGSVKERSTMTGQDSKDFIYQKGLGSEAVGTFEELGPVLRYMEDKAFKKLVYLAVYQTESKDLPKELQDVGYVEAQIFGGVDLTRDVSKIVIDEDDLDLWAAGQLLINPLLGRGTRPARNVKTIKLLVNAFGKKHNIPVQYVRSGKDPRRRGDEGNKNRAEDKLAVTQKWEEEVEQALILFQQKQWFEGIQVAQQLGNGQGLEGGTGYENMHIQGLHEIKNEAKKLYNKRKDLGKSDQNLVTTQLADLADRILGEYYNAAVKEKHREALQRVVTKAVFYLTECVINGVKKFD